MTEEVFEHNPGDHEDPAADSTWLIGVVSAIILVGSFFGLTALFYDFEEEEWKKKVVVPEVTAIKELKARQNERLTTVYRVKDQEGRFIIPIDDAIDEYLKDPYASTEISE